MKRKIIIKFEWWLNEGENSIPETHQELLEAAAEERIYEMRKDFYTSGELHQEIDGVQYDGYWDFKETNP